MAEEEKKPGFSLSDIRITLMKPKSKNYKEISAFNTYLLYQENTQRLVGDLPKGMFRLSYSVIENEFEVTRRKAQELMRYFLDNGIIKCVEKSRKKGVGSIYAYTTISYYCNSIEDSKKTDTNYDTNYDTNCDTNSDTNLSSIFNGLNGVSDTNSDTNCDTDLDTNSDTILKYNIKNNKNNNMSDSKESDAPPGAFKGDNNNSNKTNENTITTKSKGEKEKEKNSAKKKEKEQQIKEVVEYLNLKANRNYRPGTTKTKSLISARLKDYSVEDLKAVIDFKVGEWLENEKMNKYLRPETLFNETKFENYINELPSQAKGKSSQSYLEDNDVELSLDDIIKINLGKTNNQ